MLIRTSTLCLNPNFFLMTCPHGSEPPQGPGLGCRHRPLRTTTQPGKNTPQLLTLQFFISFQLMARGHVSFHQGPASVPRPRAIGLDSRKH